MNIFSDTRLSKWITGNSNTKQTQITKINQLTNFESEYGSCCNINIEFKFKYIAATRNQSYDISFLHLFLINSRLQRDRSKFSRSFNNNIVKQTVII